MIIIVVFKSDTDKIDFRKVGHKRLLNTVIKYFQSMRFLNFYLMEQILFNAIIFNTSINSEFTE